MAINEKRDVPKSVQRKQWLERNFGKDDDGYSVLGQTARTIIHAPTFGVWSKPLSGKNKGHEKVLASMLGLGATFFVGALPHIVNYEFFYDGNISNDTSYHADSLSDPFDQTGYMIIPTSDETAIMLHRDAEGHYALYQGEDHRNQSDYSFVPVTEATVASRMAFDLAQDFEVAARYSPSTVQQTLTFERISAPFYDEITEQIVRGGDNINGSVDLQSWSSADLQDLFENAALAFDQGQAISVQAEFSQDNPLNNDTIDLGTVMLTGWALMAGIGGAIALGGGIADSRRRYDRNKKRERDGFPFD